MTLSLARDVKVVSSPKSFPLPPRIKPLRSPLIPITFLSLLLEFGSLASSEIKRTRSEKMRAILTPTPRQVVENIVPFFPIFASLEVSPVR